MSRSVIEPGVRGEPERIRLPGRAAASNLALGSKNGHEGKARHWSSARSERHRPAVDVVYCEAESLSVQSYAINPAE